MLPLRTIVVAAAVYLNSSCRSNRSMVISVVITKAVTKGVAEALRAGVGTHRPRPANSAGCFGVALFVLYSLFETVRSSGGVSLRPSRLGDFCGFSVSLLLFCVSVPIWSRPIGQLRLRPRALLRCWLLRLFALPRSRKWVNWLLAGTASYGGGRHVVECQGPEPGGGHRFRFGELQSNTQHTPTT